MSSRVSESLAVDYPKFTLPADYPPAPLLATVAKPVADVLIPPLPPTKENKAVQHIQINRDSVVDDRRWSGTPSKIKTIDAGSYDIFKQTVSWSFDQGDTLGMAVYQLAEHIGYGVSTKRDVADRVYDRELPAIHLTVSDVSAEEGFKILGGNGLMTVFNHAERSVIHMPVTTASDAGSLITCPVGIASATFIAPDIYVLQDGRECTM